MWKKSDNLEFSHTKTMDDSKPENIANIDIVPENAIPKLPTRLTREICLSSSKSLSSFLKLSRTNIDDNLQTRLNSLLNHHELTNKKSILPFVKSNSTQSQCLDLINKLLYPQWFERLNAIEYCIDESSKMLHEVKTEDESINNKFTKEERDKLLNVDPYYFKDLNRANQSKTAEAHRLLNKFQNELEIEKIVTGRSTAVINDLCKLINYDVKSEFLSYTKELKKRGE